MRFALTPIAAGVGLAMMAGLAGAATQLEFEPTIDLSVPEEPAGEGTALGISANKSKLFRHQDGTLVMIYGDAVTPPVGVDEEDFLVYDLKGQAERTPRDIFVRTCQDGADRGDGTTKTCNVESDWTAPVNVSQAATLSSIESDWRGEGLETYWGDAEKPNGFINPQTGMTVVSWVSHYCPGLVDGEPTAITAPEIDRAPTSQRARLYIERDSRVIPFTCTWVAHSLDRGVTWQPAVQLSTGERAAKQDVNRGTQTWWAVTWQEDPTGLELGQAEGPGDGASGANISGGTDVWYARATAVGTGWADSGVDNSTMTWLPAVRLTDNFEGKSGTPGSLNIVFDNIGNPVDDDDIEKGRAGAARANLGSVANTVIVAWEETKGSQGLDEGKFIRYLSFPYNTPPQGGEIEGITVGTPGCIISDPERNARRVRFVTQSPADAGTGGIQIGIFWKEGVVSQGGPSDIMFRAGIGGVAASNMLPAVDSGCAPSVYEETQLLNHDRAQNISSQTKLVASSGYNNLHDDTQEQFTENALAHRGLLRGRDMWLGYSYTENLALLTYLNADNYNFWIRKFNVDAFNADPDSAWARPVRVTSQEDPSVNVREPRLVGTPQSGPACDPGAGLTEECRNADVFFVAWGTQTNVSPWAPVEAEELGLYITRTTDAGQTFEPVVQLSTAQGVFGGPLVDDEEAERAFESQLQARPDGNKIYAVWNQDVTDPLTGESTGETNAVFTSGVPVEIPVTPRRSSGGGCAYNPGAAMDWTLPGLIAAALLALGWRRRMNRG